MYVIGGIDLMEDVFDDVWTIDIRRIIDVISKAQPPDSDVWQRIPTTGDCPGKISHHKAVAIGETIWVYGGLIDHDNQPQCLYSLQTSTAKWTHVISKVK